MNLKRLKDALEDKGLVNVARRVGMAALGATPAGPAIEFIADLAGEETDDPDILAKAVETASPEQLVKLRQIDAELELGMAQEWTKRAEIERKDREDSRGYERLDKDRRTRANWLIFLITVFVVALVAADKFGVSETVIGALTLTLGGLIKALSEVFGFYFGSSSGSDMKTRSMTSRRE